MSKLLKVLACSFVMCLWAAAANATVIYDFQSTSSFGVVTDGHFKLSSTTFLSGVENPIPSSQIIDSSITADPGYSFDHVSFDTKLHSIHN